MKEREFSAVMRVHVVQFADIARIVKERTDNADRRAVGAEAHRLLGRLLVADQQAGCRQRDIQRVLPVVINRVDAVVTRHSPGEQLGEIIEGDAKLIKRFTGPGLLK